jgi:NADH pyrophosphatase NudC (nudix superfamily)
MSGYSHCGHCGHVTFTTSYGTCYLCDEMKDGPAIPHIDPRALRQRRERAQHRVILAVAISLFAAAIVTVFAILLLARKGAV